MKASPRSFPGWYLFGGLVLLLAIQSVLSAPHRQTMPYSEFKALLRAGLVRDVSVDEQTISGTVLVDSIEGAVGSERADALRRGAVDGRHAFLTVRVDDPQLVAEFEAAGVSYSGKYRGSWISRLAGWLLPAFLFLGAWVFIMRRMSPHGGLAGVGKSRAKIWMERSTGVTFADVAGIDEARAELEEIVEFLGDPGRFRRLGGKIPRGALLVGPPGVGKTLLAKAVAGEAGVPFFSLSGSDFVEMFVGVGAARVRDLFAQAQAVAPSIIFIDELDALGRARSAGVVPGGHDEREQTLNQLLAEMDGFDTTKGLIVMAATNRPEILDPALLRPGRFDRKITVDRPDLAGREQILAVHARDVPLAPGTDLARIAARTPGFSGADLANIVNEAALRGARAGKQAVDETDFDEAIDRVLAGAERRSRMLSAREKGIVAFHEAGHALIAETRPRADRVAKVSIIPRGTAALGYTRQSPTEDRFLLTRAELLDRLDVLLGGRVAEEIIFGDVSTGAQDDLQRATDLVRRMISAWGMTDALGLAAFEPPRRAMFLEIGGEPRSECSEETARRIDAELQRILEEAHGRVRDTLESQRELLEDLALLLMQKEVVTREALLALLGSAGARSGPADARHDRETDPVCRMRLDESVAVASARHDGDRYLFCSEDCRKEFQRDPRRYAPGLSGPALGSTGFGADPDAPSRGHG